MLKHYAIPLGIILMIWIGYFIIRHMNKKFEQIIAAHASLNKQRETLAEALLLIRYGAREEAIQLLKEHFDLPPDVK